MSPVRVLDGLPAGAQGRLVALVERCTFPPAGSELVCAVSGGADSLALLLLACVAGCDVTAIHVDHGIRPGSGAEARVVEAAAGRFGARFAARSVEVAPGPNLEERARMARFSVLPEDVATGHTMDDQAETVLVNLLRGAGLDGLAGMRPGVSHPILGLRRSETRSLCEMAQMVPVEDPTNSEDRFLRNRIRGGLMEACSEAAGRDVVPILARQAAILRDEADFLDLLAGDVDPSDARALASSPLVLARRAVRRWLKGDDPHPPSYGAVERVLEVARGQSRGTQVAPGIQVSRSAGRLRMSPPVPPRHSPPATAVSYQAASGAAHGAR